MSKTKRILAVVLAIAMIISVLPIYAVAADEAQKIVGLGWWSNVVEIPAGSISGFKTPESVEVTLEDGSTTTVNFDSWSSEPAELNLETAGGEYVFTPTYSSDYELADGLSLNFTLKVVDTQVTEGNSGVYMLNGIPAVINSDDGSGTYIYDATGMNKIYETDITSGTVYGGIKVEGDSTPDIDSTWVVMLDGTIAAIYGGNGLHGTTAPSSHLKDVNVKIYGGTLTSIYGAGTGGTTVATAAQVENVNFEMHGGKVSTRVAVLGWQAMVSGKATVILDGGTIAGFMPGSYSNYSGQANTAEVEVFIGEDAAITTLALLGRKCALGKLTYHIPQNNKISKINITSSDNAALDIPGGVYIYLEDMSQLDNFNAYTWANTTFNYFQGDDQITIVDSLSVNQSEIEVDNGTQLENIGLPKLISGVAVVSWTSTPDYVPTTAGEYKFVPVFADTVYLNGCSAEDVTITVKVAEAGDVDKAAITAVDTSDLVMETVFPYSEALEKPRWTSNTRNYVKNPVFYETIPATVDGETVDLPVTWTSDDYQYNQPGTYTFTAKVSREYEWQCEAPTITVRVIDGVIANAAGIFGLVTSEENVMVPQMVISLNGANTYADATGCNIFYGNADIEPGGGATISTSLKAFAGLKSTSTGTNGKTPVTVANGDTDITVIGVTITYVAGGSYNIEHTGNASIKIIDSTLSTGIYAAGGSNTDVVGNLIGDATIDITGNSVVSMITGDGLTSGTVKGTVTINLHDLGDDASIGTITRGDATKLVLKVDDADLLASLTDAISDTVEAYVGDKKITAVVKSFTPQSEITKTEGEVTDQTQLGLPADIDGVTVESWTVKEGSFDGSKAGTYTFVPVFADSVVLIGCTAEDAAVTVTIKAASVVPAKKVTGIQLSQTEYEIEFDGDKPTLPTSVTATVDGVADQTIDGITWTDDNNFDNRVAGDYTFTLVLPEGYEMDGEAAPTIKITVKPSTTASGMISEVDMSGLVTETYFPYSQKVDAKPRWSSNTVNYVTDPVFYKTLPANVDGDTVDVTVTWTSEDYKYDEFGTYTFTAVPEGKYEGYEWASEVPSITVTVFDGVIANGSGLFGLLTSVEDFQVPYIIVPLGEKNTYTDATGCNMLFGIASGGVETDPPGVGSFGTTGKAVAGLKDTSTGTNGKTPVTTSTGKTNLTIKGTELAYASAGSANMDHTGTGKITLINATITTAIYAAGDAGNVIGESLIDVSGNSVVPLITGDGHTSGTVQGTVTVNLHDLGDDASIGSVTRGGATKLVLKVDDAKYLAALEDTLEDGVVEAYVGETKVVGIVKNAPLNKEITKEKGTVSGQDELGLPEDIDGVKVESWTVTPAFDANTADTYKFVPVFAEGVFLVGLSEEDVTITVTITADAVVVPKITAVDTDDMVLETWFTYDRSGAGDRYANTGKSDVTDPTFYPTLKVTVDGEETELPVVSWTCTDEGGYKSSVFGTYHFEPVVSGNYDWQADKPVITVYVIDGVIASAKGNFAYMTRAENYNSSDESVPHAIIIPWVVKGDTGEANPNTFYDATGFNRLYLTNSFAPGTASNAFKAAAGISVANSGTAGRTINKVSEGDTHITISDGAQVEAIAGGSRNVVHTGDTYITFKDSTASNGLYGGGYSFENEYEPDGPFDATVIGNAYIDISGNVTVALVSGGGIANKTGHDISLTGTAYVTIHDLTDAATITKIEKGGAAKLVVKVDDAEILASLADTLEDGVVEAYVNDVKVTHLVKDLVAPAGITGAEGEFADEAALNLPTTVSDGTNDIPVKSWKAEKTFDGFTAGVYTFVPEFEEGVFLIGGVTADKATLTVTITAAVVMKVANITGYEPAYATAWGTDPTLPTSVTADVVEPISMPGQTINGVTWEPDPTFDNQIPGDYTFTMVLPLTHKYADGTTAPTVTVTVQPYAGAVITAFDVPVQRTEFLTGTVTSPVFYDTLTVTISENGTESTETISGLTWKCDNYNSAYVAGGNNVYTFTIDPDSIAGGYVVADSAIANAAISVEMINAKVQNTYGHWKTYGDKPVSGIYKGIPGGVGTYHTLYDLTGFNVLSANTVTGNANTARGGIWAGTGNNGKTLGAPITEEYIGIIELSTGTYLTNFALGGFGVDIPQDMSVFVSDNVEITNTMYAGSASAAFNADSYITFRSDWSGNVNAIVAASNFDSKNYITGSGGDVIGSSAVTKHNGTVIITIEDGATGTIGSISRGTTEAWACQRLEVWIPADKVPSDYNITIDNKTFVYVGGVLWTTEDEADVTDLIKAISEAADVQRELYTDNSLAVLDAAVKAAQDAIESKISKDEQDKVDAMAQAIRDAIKALTLKAGAADYTAVEEAIAKFEAIDKSNLTKASVAAVEAAIAAVEYDLPDSQQDKVNEMAAAIEAAIADLKTRADYSAVEAALEKVPADLSKYTEDTVANLQAALNALDDDLAVEDQDKVTKMAEAIEAALSALKKYADYTAVDAALKKVPSVLTPYTDESVANLNAAVNAVVRGLTEDDQDKVDAMAAAILAAVDALELKSGSTQPGDYTAVDAAVARAKAIDRSKYTAASLKALDDAVAAVIYGLTADRQKQINLWAANIVAALDALQPSSGNAQRPNISGGGSSSGGTSGGVNTGTQTPAAQGFNKTNTYVPNVTFIDVPTDSWFYSNVQSAYEYTLMLGKTANEFKPDDTMTVAEAITIAARMNSIYNGKTVPTNSTTGNWYDSYVTYAINNGIIAAGDFTNYNANATRAQMAKIFVNAVPATWLNQINSINAIPDMEADDADTAAVLTLYRAGVCTGSDEEHNFKPDTDIKRSEVAAIISRLVNKTLRQNFDI